MGLRFRKSHIQKLIEDHRSKLDNLFEGDEAYGPLEEREFSDADREKKAPADFVFPDRKAWPYKPEAFAWAAVRRMGEDWGKKSDYSKIAKAIASEYGKDSAVAKAAAKVAR